MLRIVTGYNEDVLRECKYDMAIVPMNTLRESLCGFGTYLLSLNRELNIKSNDNPSRRVGTFTWINNNDGLTVVAPLLHDVRSDRLSQSSFQDTEVGAKTSIEVLLDLTYQAINAGKKCIFIPAFRIGRHYISSKMFIDAFRDRFHHMPNITILLFFKSHSFIPPYHDIVTSTIPPSRPQPEMFIGCNGRENTKPTKRIIRHTHNPYAYS